MQLLDAREQVRRRARARVERRLLVRVLAVAQIHDLLVGVAPARREAPALARGEPRRDRRVVARRARERLARERFARLQRKHAAGVAQLIEHTLVVARVDDDGRERAVLGRRPDHRRAADVDVLDHLVLGRVAARDGLLERVQVHAHEVHLLDPMLGRRAQVRILVAPRQQARVQPRVQRLHAPIHHLREAREVLDRAHLDAGAGQLARGAAGRHELHAQISQPLRERDDPQLVGDRQQRPRDAHLARLRALDPSCVIGHDIAFRAHPLQIIPRPCGAPRPRRGRRPAPRLRQPRRPRRASCAGSPGRR